MKLITRLRRVEYTATCYGHDKLHTYVIGKRERVQVRCSVLVGSDLPHSLIDVRQNAASLKVQGSTMSRLRSHNFREAVSDLLTVTMHLQDALTRFHRPCIK